jgi:hypothetical protein
VATEDDVRRIALSLPGTAEYHNANVRVTEARTWLTEVRTLRARSRRTLNDRQHYEHPLVVPQLPQT